LGTLFIAVAIASIALGGITVAALRFGGWDRDKVESAAPVALSWRGEASDVSGRLRADRHIGRLG
jgi:hypothetical protein